MLINVDLINVDKIIVRDRIRKDFGDIQELAEDIEQNTLLNALVVTPSGNGDGTYILIAGERRLRAMRDILGYKAVPVNSVGAEDSEQALLMEISENECRKEFTKTERLDYARRLARIESAKAKERQGTRTDMVENSPLSSDAGKTRDKVAETLGTSSNTIAREQFIEDHRDMLDSADFAEWDEGKLSTNKAFQRIKAAQKRAEEERDAAMSDAEMTSMLYGQAKTQLAETQGDLESTKEELASERGKNLELGSQMESLKRQLAEQPKPEVIEREVVPDEVQRRVSDLEDENERLNREYQQMWHKKMELDKKLEQAQTLLGEKERTDNATWDVQVLTTATNNYLRQYGGKAWAFDQFYRVDEVTQGEFIKAITNLAAFAQNLAQMVKEKGEMNGKQ